MTALKKPCPFCGESEDGIETHQVADHWETFCQECGATVVPYESAQKARAAWNRRASSLSLTDLLTKNPALVEDLVQHINRYRRNVHNEDTIRTFLFAWTQCVDAVQEHEGTPHSTPLRPLDRRSP